MTTLQKTFWLSLPFKLILVALLPLTNDESYYWVWSQNLQLSYYDHPPIVAWLFWLGEQVRWVDGMVRWPGVVLGHVTIGLWLLLLRPILTEEQRFYWLLLALFSPLIGGTHLIVTPDLPLLFFNALSLLLLVRWMKQREPLVAALLGVAMGLGFSSKYVMVLFPLSLLPVVLWQRESRQLLARHWPLLLMGGLLGTAPVWIWNYLNDFASIRFQAEHGLGRSWKPRWSLEYIGVQLGVIFPVILYWALRARGPSLRLFHFMAWVPLIFFFATTTRGYVEANWPIVAYPPLFVLAVAALPANRRSLQVTLGVWILFLSGMTALILNPPTWSRPLKLREFHQFDAVLQDVKEIEPLFARSYQMAARLHFELGRPVYKLKGMNRRDFYDFLPSSDPQTSEFYLLAEKQDKLPAIYRERGFVVLERKGVASGFELWKVGRQ